MDKAQALFSFWSGFGWPAIDEQSGMDSATAEMLEIRDRYISYETAEGSLGDEIPLTASLYHRSTSWAEVEAKTKQISETIGWGGLVLPIDGGKLWLKRGSPFAQRMGDGNNNDWRRIVLSVTAEFLTAN